MQIRWIRWIRWLVVSTKDYSLHLLAHVQSVQSVQSCLLWKINMDQLLQFTVLICADLYCLALHWSLHIFALRAHISTLQIFTGLLPWTPDLHILHVSCGLIGIMTVACSAPVTHLLKVTQDSWVKSLAVSGDAQTKTLSSIICILIVHRSSIFTPRAPVLLITLVQLQVHWNQFCVCIIIYLFIYVFRFFFSGKPHTPYLPLFSLWPACHCYRWGRSKCLLSFSYFHTCSYMFIHVHTFFMSVHALCMSVLWHANRIEHWCQFVSVQETIVVFVCLPA